MTLDAWVTVAWHEPRLAFNDDCLTLNPDLQALALWMDEANTQSVWRPPLEMGNTVSVEEVPGFKSDKQFWYVHVAYVRIFF